MTEQPPVCALLLTADRQFLTDRAVRSFLAQDYERKSLLIYDTGKVPYVLPMTGRPNTVTLVRQDLRGETLPIGKLRNWALQLLSKAASSAIQLDMTPGCDIICHFDSDDWSAPSRISDQVKLLVESGKQAVGYREMLFWDSRQKRVPAQSGRADAPWSGEATIKTNEAWLYSNTDPRYIISTSLCYWRTTWEALPFAETMTREWRPWLQPGGLDTLGVSGTVCAECAHHGHAVRARQFHKTANLPGRSEEPLMIAELHGSNTCAHESLDPRGVNRDCSLAWRRVPAWDERVRQILESA